MTDDEWAEAALHALLLKCMARAADVLVWLDEIEEWG